MTSLNHEYKDHLFFFFFYDHLKTFTWKWQTGAYVLALLLPCDLVYILCASICDSVFLLNSNLGNFLDVVDFLIHSLKLSSLKSIPIQLSSRMHALNQWVCATSIGFNAVPPTFHRLKNTFQNLLLHSLYSFPILQTNLWIVKNLTKW